jgi:RNA recognition motif-containing protein
MENLEMNKLFIGNLHWNVRRPTLKEHFMQRGEVAYASVALDKEQNRSRGFGFVTFVNEADATKAQAEANETEFE